MSNNLIGQREEKNYLNCFCIFIVLNCLFLWSWMNSSKKTMLVPFRVKTWCRSKVIKSPKIQRSCCRCTMMLASPCSCWGFRTPALLKAASQSSIWLWSISGNRFCWVKGVIAACTGEKRMLLCQCQVSPHFINVQRETCKWWFLFCQLNSLACRGCNGRSWNEKNYNLAVLLYNSLVLCICSFYPICIWICVSAILVPNEGNLAIFGS